MIFIQHLEEELPRPSDADCALMRGLKGGVIALGAGGKMGPSLARRARRASDQPGTPRGIIAVSCAGSAAASPEPASPKESIGSRRRTRN